MPAVTVATAQAAACLNNNRVSIPKYIQLSYRTEQDPSRVISKGIRDNTHHKGSANAVART
jgi:hypothetical protein